MADEKWIGGADIHKGGLHETLGIPDGQKIPRSKVIQAAHSEDPKERKEGVLAETFAHIRPHGSESKVAHHPHGRPHAHGAE